MLDRADNCIFGERFRMRMYVRHRLRHVMVVSVHALGSSLEVLFKSLLAPHQNITAALKRHRVIKTAESALRLLMAPQSKRVGFLDLSAELRNRVYEPALIAEQCLKLRHNSNPNVYGTATHGFTCQLGRCYSAHWIEPSLTPNILLTCRQVQAEATPMLYGSNTFDLTRLSPCHSVEFLTQISTSIQHLRGVYLRVLLSMKEPDKQSDVQKMLRLLEGAPHIVELKFSPEGIIFPSPKQLADLITPLCKVLQATRQKVGGECQEPVMEVLGFLDAWVQAGYRGHGLRRGVGEIILSK
ncbi:hypothetical protein CLAFUW4_13398 [Fulvia fulva]|nr:hypothetical protein CLAFUR4_13402 [Fulvia fulva]WPV21624.1 hypothetical protein CLAFUW4_13398 [Fulvia fulva]WPV35844.1 hypothetical protein CLAFUW7_13405 [Fulvia fulva]